jgi:hypothetical protein
MADSALLQEVAGGETRMAGTHHDDVMRSGSGRQPRQTRHREHSQAMVAILRDP